MAQSITNNESPNGAAAATPSSDDLRARVAALAPWARETLEALVRIPSVSAVAFDQGHVLASARAVAALVGAAGFEDARILSVLRPDGTPGAPAVVAHRPAPEQVGPKAPTVLLYAHHDVQPPGEASTWSSEPFEPFERDGRLYGRGAADDKAGLVVHLTALAALGEDLGVAVTVFIEGEEEIGSPSFEAFLRQYRAELAADVIIVADSGNWTIGTPALTTSLRGLVDGVIEVATLDHSVHSGMYGGAVPDAITALIRLLNGLWDEHGQVTIPGLSAGPADDLGYTEASLRQDAGVLPGVELVGQGSIEARLWTHPALTVIGIDAPSVALASNTLSPVARAKFSLRIAPGQDPRAAFEALRTHVLSLVPFGAKVSVELGELGQPWAGDLDGEVYDLARSALREAWGAEPVHMGVGGSIPFIAALQEVYPEAVVLVTGVEDPDTRAHGADESVHLGEFERACLAETLFLAALARSSR